jgi:hypothetical protein
LPDEGRICVEIAQMTGQQLGLHEPQQSNRHFLVQESMLNFIALALLIGHEHSLAPFFAEQHCSAVEAPEIPLRQLAAIDRRQHKAVGKKGPELVDQILASAARTASGEVSP